MVDEQFRDQAIASRLVVVSEFIDGLGKFIRPGRDGGFWIQEKLLLMRDHVRSPLELDPRSIALFELGEHALLTGARTKTVEPVGNPGIGRAVAQCLDHSLCCLVLFRPNDRFAGAFLFGAPSNQFGRLGVDFNPLAVAVPCLPENQRLLVLIRLPAIRLHEFLRFLEASRIFLRGVGEVPVLGEF